MVPCLPSKQESLNSNPNTMEKRRKKEGRKERRKEGNRKCNKEGYMQ
jgi:hypothetical protein